MCASSARRLKLVWLYSCFMSFSDSDASSNDETRTREINKALKLETKCTEIADYIECYYVQPSDVKC